MNGGSSSSGAGNGHFLPLHIPSSSSKRPPRPSSINGSSANGPRKSMISGNPRQSMVSNPRQSLRGPSRQSFIPSRSTPVARQQQQHFQQSFLPSQRPTQQQQSLPLHVQMGPVGSSNSSSNFNNEFGPIRPGLAGDSLADIMQRSTVSRRSMAPSAAPGSVQKRFGGNGVTGPNFGTSSGAGALPTSAYRRNNARQSSLGVSTTPIPSSAPGSSSSSTTAMTRTTRDKDQIAHSEQFVYDYLQENNFQQETNCPLSMKLLHNPPQKDFAEIFKWLYHRVDPGYQFGKNIGHDVYLILKAIHYPFLDSITKSQLSAVGGANWHSFIAMLHWLVELNMTLDVFNKREFPGAEENEINMVDQILFKHMAKAYTSYILDGVEDNSPFQAAMEEEFYVYNRNIVTSMEDISETTKDLETKYRELSKKPLARQQLEDKIKVLNTDISNFRDYFARMEISKEKRMHVVKSLEEDLKRSEADLKRAQAEKTQIQAQIESQKLQPAEIDRMQVERQKTATSLDIHKDRLEEMEKIHADKESTAQEALQELESCINQYMKACYRLGIDRSKSLSAAIQQDPTLFTIAIDDPLSDASLSQPSQLRSAIEKKLQMQVRPLLSDYRHEISDRIHQAQDEYIKIQEQLDTTNEAVAEKHDLVESLKAKLNVSTLESNSLYETMNSETAASNTEIEKMELKIQELKREVSHGQMQLQQRSQNIAIEYDNLKRHAQLTRQALEAESEKMLSDLINLKAHVHEALEDYENFVADEYKALQNTDALK